MQTYRCIIIEDELTEQQLLRLYLSRLPHVQLLGLFTNPLDALPALYQETIDILFLDVNLPGMNGLSFLASLNNPPKVILTTANPAYALDAYEAGVVDYLVKPYTFDRLLKAINRAVGATSQAGPANLPTHLFLKTGRESVRVIMSDILYIEAFGPLSKVHTPSGVLVVSELLADLLLQLPAGDFVRVHKSYVAARRYITKLSAKFIFVNQHQLPLGATYREEVAKALKV